MTAILERKADWRFQAFFSMKMLELKKKIDKFIRKVVIYPKSAVIQEKDWRQAISWSNVDKYLLLIQESLAIQDHNVQ